MSIQQQQQRPTGGRQDVVETQKGRWSTLREAFPGVLILLVFLSVPGVFVVQWMNVETNQQMTVKKTSMRPTDFASYKAAKATIDSLAPSKTGSSTSSEETSGGTWWYLRPVKVPSMVGWPLSRAKEQRMCIGADARGVYLYNTDDSMWPPRMPKLRPDCQQPTQGGLAAMARWQLTSDGTWATPKPAPAAPKTPQPSVRPW